MPDILFAAPGNYTSYLTTALNGLASGTLVLGATITPATTGRRLYMDVALVTGSYNPTANSAWNLFVLPTVDDTATNFLSIESARPRDTFFIDTAATGVVRYMLCERIQLPNRAFQMGIRGTSGSLAATGNVLSYSVYTETA